jgi:hypothetical protein
MHKAKSKGFFSSAYSAACPVSGQEVSGMRTRHSVADCIQLHKFGKYLYLAEIREVFTYGNEKTK